MRVLVKHGKATIVQYQCALEIVYPGHIPLKPENIRISLQRMIVLPTSVFEESGVGGPHLLTRRATRHHPATTTVHLHHNVT